MIADALLLGVFLSVSLTVFSLGRLLFGIGRNQPNEPGARSPALGWLTEAFAGVIPSSPGTRNKLRQELVQAGYYARTATDEFLALRNAAMTIWLIFVGCVLVAAIEPDSPHVNSVLIGGLVGLLLIYAIPRIVLGGQAKGRVQRIQYALPDALDMITMTMTGGLPMQRAIERVSGELRAPHPDLACELAIIGRQSDAASLELALKQFSQRIDLPEVSGLTALVSQTERLGANVSEAFRDFADSVRRTRRQRAEERGNRSSVKLLFPIVLCLAPPVYVMLLGPAALEMKNFFLDNRRSGSAIAQEIEDAQASPLTRIATPEGN